MSGITTEFQGLDKLIQKLDKVANPVKYEKALKDACLLVEREAKKKAPKGDGDLRRSITSKVEINNDGAIGVVYTPLEYAPYVEYGTGLFAEGGNGRKEVPWLYEDEKGVTWITYGQHPHPYLRPAFYENRNRILEILKEGATND